MKHGIFILMASVLLGTQACSNGNAETNDQGAPPESKEPSVIHADLTAPGAPGAIHITKNDFLEKVWDFEANSDKWIYKGDKPCIIDFYADWCGPCKIAAPILEELAIEYSNDIYVYKIDTEKERELAAAFGIRSIPAFLYCPTEGEPQMAAGIGRSPAETKQMFKGIIDDFLLGKK